MRRITQGVAATKQSNLRGSSVNKLCDATVNGRVVAIRTSGSLTEPNETFSAWYWNPATYRVRRRKKHVYPYQDLFETCGRRVVIEYPDWETVPIGQVVVASGLKAVLAWLREHIVPGSLVSPILAEML